MAAPSPVLSAPAQSAVKFHNYPLLAGGYFSLAFSIFQISAIWWTPGVIRYFGGPANLSVQRPLTYAVLCIVVGLIVAVFGIYALSGGGMIRRLPLLRTLLAIATAIYILRGLLLIPQVPLVLKHPELVRFLIFSVIALVVGFVLLVGTVQTWKIRKLS